MTTQHCVRKYTENTRLDVSHRSFHNFPSIIYGRYYDVLKLVVFSQPKCSFRACALDHSKDKKRKVAAKIGSLSWCAGRETSSLLRWTIPSYFPATLGLFSSGEFFKKQLFRKNALVTFALHIADNQIIEYLHHTEYYPQFKHYN